MTTEISEKDIKSLNYIDFIALINQTNVPPGSFSTLTRWKVNSGMNAASNIFEIACTTGFSLLNLIKSLKCRGVGVDISKASIEAAKQNAVEMDLQTLADFHCHDASTYKTDEIYSHIIVGASLGFFTNPKLMIENIFSMVHEEAYILASPFYAVKEVPSQIVEDCQRILGITPTVQNYKETMRLYRGFDIEYEDRLSSFCETEDELKHYCDSTIVRACQRLGITSSSLYDLLYKRLYEVKNVCNTLRNYQNYSVLVLKYNRKHYPNRYVELF
ncbi:MAG: hypothetical protein CK425_10260 [Parachlamydia sp.]|nr:MAG: hypothetical protein CK425_10260 [Parachlamydia sp.]